MQRLALLGGIYSNYRALAVALEDARRRGVDGVYCLGDLGGFGPYPDRVFPLLRRSGVQTIRGNYDDSLALGLPDCQCGYTDPRDNYFARLSYAYTFRNTSSENKAWLGTLPAMLRLEIEGARLLLCHGSPLESRHWCRSRGTSAACRREGLAVMSLRGARRTIAAGRARPRLTWRTARRRLPFCCPLRYDSGRRGSLGRTNPSR